MYKLSHLSELMCYIPDLPQSVCVRLAGVTRYIVTDSRVALVTVYLTLSKVNCFELVTIKENMKYP